MGKEWRKGDRKGREEQRKGWREGKVGG